MICEGIPPVKLTEDTPLKENTMIQTAHMHGMRLRFRTIGRQSIPVDCTDKQIEAYERQLDRLQGKRWRARAQRQLVKAVRQALSQTKETEQK